MNRKLSYNGKTLKEMTKSELHKQYDTNITRLKIRTGFLGACTVASCFVMPVVAVVPLGIAGITDYWLIKNNNAIKDEIESR